MVTKMRRSDRAIAESEAKEILQKAEYGILSTVSLDGQPYGVPLSFSYTGNAIYFHCAAKGHKLENLSINNRVSFCVVGRTHVLPEEFATNYESVIVFGEAFEITGDEKRQGLVEILKKYCPDVIEKGLQYIESDGRKTRVYKIGIESMSGKSRKG
jgi:nitroimidazol reductase NimA-like FMN-containing flavoprotein (pyridoxamine 5'-phosphate oxidase superfamily)